MKHSKNRRQLRKEHACRCCGAAYLNIDSYGPVARTELPNGQIKELICGPVPTQKKQTLRSSLRKLPVFRLTSSILVSVWPLTARTF